MRLMVVGVLEILGLMLIISRTKQLQEIYYYGIGIHAFDNLQEAINIQSILDGYLKEIRCEFATNTTYSGGSQTFNMMMQTSVRKGDFYNKYAGGANTAWRDPFGGAGDFSTETIFSFTSPQAGTADMWYVNGTINYTSFYKARINQILKKNEEFIVEHWLTTMDQGQNTAGLSEIRWELKLVVAPFVFWFDQPKGLGLKFTQLIHVTTTLEIASTEFPCSGYLTNISVHSTGPSGAADFPQYFVWTTDDPNLATHLLTVAGTNGITGSSKNSIVMQNVRQTSSEGTKFTWNFQHFGKKYIRITNRDMLNFIFKSQGADSITLIFQADFIPFKNAHWKQVYTHDASLGTSENWGDAMEMMVDLTDCQVAIVAKIATAEEGVMVVKLIHENTDSGSFADGVGDVHDVSPFSDDGVSSAQNLGAIIPFSGSMGSSNSVLHLGTVTAGQLLVWDFISGTLSGASEVYFIVTGKVNNEYYSRGSRFNVSPSLFDYANMEALHAF